MLRLELFVFNIIIFIVLRHFNDDNANEIFGIVIFIY